MDDLRTVARIALPVANGDWVEATLPAPAGGARLEKAELDIEPPTAFRMFRVYRQSDGALLANGGWDRSRTRPIKVIPADARVGPGDGVRFTARGWDHAALAGVVTWTPA